MNDLSLFLYLVDVLGELSNVFEFLTVGLVVAIGVLIFVRWMFMEVEGMEDETKASAEKLLKKTIVAAVVVSLVSVLIPSERTMYLMLGSEVGEEVITSDTGKKVQKAIDKKLDEYLKTGE